MATTLRCDKKVLRSESMNEMEKYRIPKLFYEKYVFLSFQGQQQKKNRKGLGYFIQKCVEYLIYPHTRTHTLYSVLNTIHRRVSRWINIVLNVNVIILYKSYFISFVFLLLQYFAEKTHQTTALWLISFIYCNNCNQCHSKAALYIRMRRIHCHAFRFHDLQRYVYVFFVFLIEINRKHVLAWELPFVQ